MDKQINIEETLDWYILAGVNETCSGEVCLAENPAKKPSLPEKSAPFCEQTSNISKNARDICLSAQTLENLKELLLQFDGCNLKNTANSTVFGEGNANAKIMLIGEAPGADEDRIGRPFVGKCGKLLDKMLSSISVKRENCYISNVLPWRPPGNRTPTDDEIAICLPFLKRQIELVDPDFILLLGGIALKSVMDCPDSISRTRGKWLEYTTSQGKIIPVLATYHPSYLLRSCSQKSRAWVDLLRLKSKM